MNNRYALWLLAAAFTGVLCQSACSDKTETCDPESCAPGFRCPEDGASCVPDPGVCANNNDCPLSEYCDNGICRPFSGAMGSSSCRSAADCYTGLSCTLGLCTGCVDNLQCGQGGSCVLGVCISNPFAPPASRDLCEGAECEEGTVCVSATGDCAATCESAADCAEEQICDSKLGRCVAQSGCDTDTDCQDGVTCLFGVCVGCTIDDQCRDDETCVFGACIAPLDLGELGRCEGNECPEGQFCNPITGECLPETCQEDEHCDEGEICTVLGTCASCVSDSQCEEGESCALLLGECVNLDLLGRCEEVSCPGQMCDPITGLCFLGEPCRDDDECPDDMICNVMGLCAHCWDSNDCAEGEFCEFVSGECRTECEVNADCPSDEQCAQLAGVCVPAFGCITSDDCPDPLACLLGVCVGCRYNSECEVNQLCYLGACIPNLAPFGICDKPDCADDEYCHPLTGQCVPYEGCRTSRDCAPGLECNAFGLCAGCTPPDVGCRPSEVCRAGTCVPEPVYFDTPAGLCEGVTCDEASHECIPNTGECEKTCLHEGHCESHEFCDPELTPRHCVPEVGCADSGDCKPRQICLAGLCYMCQGDTDCREGESCILGFCVPPISLDGIRSCGRDRCDAGEFCSPLTMTCIPVGYGGYCQNDADCGDEGLECDELAGICYRCLSSGVDCPEGYYCHSLDYCLPDESSGGGDPGGGDIGGSGGDPGGG